MRFSILLFVCFLLVFSAKAMAEVPAGSGGKTTPNSIKPSAIKPQSKAYPEPSFKPKGAAPNTKQFDPRGCDNCSGNRERHP
ncbi:MAG: hypothetical protein HY537_04530 [Deltaproteobacteria bacterium]|nr:hypothetical protein [Deltaproteobacteria bacterium]